MLVVRRVLVRSREADEFKPCACLDENTRREDGVGKPLCVSKREGGKEGSTEFPYHAVSCGQYVMCGACPGNAL